jgi:hypothetical protein
MTRDAEMVQTAREAVRPTQRWHSDWHDRPKSAIEERARILYKRQYRAVMSLYREKRRYVFCLDLAAVQDHANAASG